MKLSDLKETHTLHHAYLVVGNAHATHDVASLLEGRGVSVHGNPDFNIENYEEMKVDDVRDILQPFAYLKPLADEKFLIISFLSANHQAQNALLKIVEEAPGGTHFFFCVDAIGNVLPTLRSRCIVVSSPYVEKEISAEREAAKLFMTSSFPERLAVVEKMTAQLTRTQDRGPVRLFVRALIEEIHGQAFSMGHRDLLDSDGYLRLSGSSAKSILGHLAVTLPRL